jgi:ABC-type polysaccharide/polyol phosphate export permease
MDEKGEGVVSSAVAVVIFSALGVAMWFAFRNTMDTATSMVTSQISQLGN